MLNNVILIGRLVETPTMQYLNDNTKVSNIKLAVMRPFRNADGEFGTDFIPISLWHGTADMACEYCSKGDVIGIKGRIAERVTDQNGINIHSLDIVGERLILIQTSSHKDGSFVNKKEVAEEDQKLL